MADHKLDHDWSIASHVMYAALAPHTSKNKRLKPDDLNPRHKAHKGHVVAEQLDEKQSMDILRRVFSDPTNIQRVDDLRRPA